jgi:hypothetical protein
MEKSILSTYSHTHSFEDNSVQEYLKKYIKDGDWSKSEFTAMTDPLMVGWAVRDSYTDALGNQIEAQFLTHHVACRNDTVPVSFM